MEEDVGVRKLVELIFVKNFQITAEIASQDSSFPPCLLISDFPQKLQCVLLIRQSIVSDGWRKALKKYNPERQLASEHYLNFVMSSCLIENTLENKVFETFLSTCGLVRFFSQKTFQLSGLNFWDVNSDIFLEFYASVLKKSFLKCGGFQQFVGYIHRHRYLKWNLNVNDLAPLDDLSGQVDVHVAEKIEKEKMKEVHSRASGITRKLCSTTFKTICDTMVQKVLITASDKLATLTSSHGSNQTEDAINRSELATLTSSHDSNQAEEAINRSELATLTSSHDLNRTEEGINRSLKAKTTKENSGIKDAALKSEPSEDLSRCLSLNSDSKTNHATEQKEYAQKNESIVHRVMKYNYSKGPDLANYDKQLLEKAKGILNHLEDTLKSLIKVLDEYDKE